MLSTQESVFAKNGDEFLDNIVFVFRHLVAIIPPCQLLATWQGENQPTQSSFRAYEIAPLTIGLVLWLSGAGSVILRHISFP